MRALDYITMVTIHRASVLTAEVDYNIRVSPRARNVTLKVNRANGLVVVVPVSYTHLTLPTIYSV